jgi:hypothetical protein
LFCRRMLSPHFTVGRREDAAFRMLPPSADRRWAWIGLGLRACHRMSRELLSPTQVCTQIVHRVIPKPDIQHRLVTTPLGPRPLFHGASSRGWKAETRS